MTDPTADLHAPIADDAVADPLPEAIETPNGAHRPRRPGRLIGEIVVDLGFADQETVEAAVATSRATGKPTGRVLVDDETLTEEQLARVVAERFGVQYIDLNATQVDMTAANLVSPGAAKRFNAIPVAFVDSATLLVAMADPTDVMAIDDIAMMTGYNIRPAVAAVEDIATVVGRINRLEDAVQEAVGEEDQALDPTEVTDLRESAQDAPIVKLVRSIIAQGVDQGASDIHLDPAEGDMQVRYRIDGVMADATVVPRRMVLGVVSRLKIMADLDISERRLPQDGRMGLNIEDRRVDIRVSVLPLVLGESVTLRILDSGGVPIGLDELGMESEERERLERALSRPFGGVLATGPTGSGKSTTIYAALNEVRTREKTIVTIEDPVEYRIAGIKQVQVNEKTGLTFARGLRSIMRADPDIVMVGEIRDPESAHIGMEAAVTGHVVLSTLHTNDAPTAITRLIQMGIEPFLVASAVECVVAQRLARRLCTSCKRSVTVAGAVLGEPERDEVEVFEAVGCQRCGGMGYRGRVGLFEVMEVTEEMRTFILERSSSEMIGQVARHNGMRTLREDGFAKVREGVTSLAEIARVTGS